MDTPARDRVAISINLPCLAFSNGSTLPPVMSVMIAPIPTYYPVMLARGRRNLHGRKCIARRIMEVRFLPPKRNAFCADSRT